MDANMRKLVYLAAMALAVIVGGLVLFGVVTADKVQEAVIAASALVSAFAGFLAFKNVPPAE